ncbi:MAG TPA: pantoate--beta-alanine ligase [Bacteroidales bacterium]|jgi:pantoate--beta-alanine ligase|nr:pantoate--beta-alanine ligase [Bacteroidales bacterium]HNR40910.1 pantoate--beta-alanine ligase [Bacteroidales bacterium]HPM18030.1 pantoate--beta-alanine ligase [Bacteroidales bacterium]HQG76545.1 pantoate--beta-alanine ligase [Bacteroidales bacterium]
MKVISKAEELEKAIGGTLLSPVGFVPTMGALHAGHLSLVNRATDETPLVVTSIYVNPTQFNDPKDLENYPRTLEEDLALLKNHLRTDDIVFTPSDREIYPEKDTRQFHFGNLDNVMEALHRPGHFNGVAQVVSRLFAIVRPDIAYFGQKDFQQLAVIRELVRQTGNRVRIVGCPIIREADGLAMSSRNRLLDPEIRKNAATIFKALNLASERFKSKEIAELKKDVKDMIEKIPGFTVEYFEIADDIELIPLKNKSEVREGCRYFGCIAVMAGKIRLIDNIEIQV